MNLMKKQIIFYLPNVDTELQSDTQSLYLAGLPYASFDTNFRHLKNLKRIDFQVQNLNSMHNSVSK